MINPTNNFKNSNPKKLLDEFDKASKRINPSLLEKYRNKFKNMDPNKRKELEASICNLFMTDEIKKNKRESLQKKMKYNDLTMMTFAFIGIITNVISSSMYLKAKHIKDSEGKINIQLIPNETKLIRLLRTITSITTFLLIIFLIRHYNIRIKFLIMKQKISVASSLYSTGLIWKLLSEILICLIHSPPYLNDICITFSSTTGTNHEKYRESIPIPSILCVFN